MTYQVHVSGVKYIGWVKPVLSLYQFVEDATCSDCSRQTLSLDWRKRDGEGKIQPWTSPAWYPSCGLRYVWSRKGFIQLVEKRDADTFTIIHQNVPLGTEIWSDEWHAYSRLNELGYVYKTVNHSRNFKDPVPGDCMNHVEAYWNAVNRRFKRMCGTTRALIIDIWTDRFLWYFWQWFLQFLVSRHPTQMPVDEYLSPACISGIPCALRSVHCRRCCIACDTPVSSWQPRTELQVYAMSAN